MNVDRTQPLHTLGQKVSHENAALLVIDVQNDFVATDGFFDKLGADVQPIQEYVVPALRRLIDQARSAGVPVIFVRAIYDDRYLSDAMRERNIRRNVTMDRCLEGSWGADFYEVAPLPGELVITKHRYSAVWHTGLLGKLRERGIVSLLLTGVATDTCVESTGRDAYFDDFYVTLVSDCCGAFNEDDHRGACKRFDRDYGAVVSSDQIIGIWNNRASGVQTDLSAAAESWH